MKKKIIVGVSLFVLIFTSLLLIATFYDLQISEFLAASGFKDGQYFSNNIFGRVFEVIGEMPLYLFIMLASAIIITNATTLSKRYLKNTCIILFFTIGGLFSFFGLYKILKYLYLFYPTTLNKIYHHYFTYILLMILGFTLQLLLSYLCLKKFYKGCIKLLPFAIIVLLTAMCSQMIVQGIKPFFARERYRAIYYLTYRNLPQQGFTKWYILNGNAYETAALYASEHQVTSTFFSSFPSGHTCGAGITYTCMFIPFYLEKMNTKKYKWLFMVFPILITGIVGFSRIVMGAHYLSDVLFGGTITFICSLISFIIVFKILKYIKKETKKEL